MKKVIYLFILALLTLSGCEDFYQKGDELIQDANAVAGGVRAIMDSAAGPLIPPDLKVYGLLGIGLINAVVIGWEELRNRTMKKTTKAIVKGIENTANPDKATSEVKANIAEEMRRQGGDKFYAKANKIVDNLILS